MTGSGQWSMDDAYELLMSPLPSTQAAAAAMIRNFGTAATLMAADLRANGARGDGAGDAGAAMRAQSEAHAEWFDQVAANAGHAAGKLEALAHNGNTYQADGLQIYNTIQQSIAQDQQDHSGANDMHQVTMQQEGSRQLSAKVSDWGTDYAGFTAPAPPPVPTANSGTYGGRSEGGGGAGGSVPVTSGGGHGTTSSGAQRDAAFIVPAGAAAAAGTGRSKLKVVAGGPGSVEVGSDGGDFAGWYKDPRTGYYVDPQTGREYDPVSQRWVDPVTGQPFGAVAKYATGLQGLGPESTTGGLLAESGAVTGGGLAGDPAAFAAAYGGALPPALANGSAASGALWTQAGRSLAVNRAMAAELVGREQAARAGRPYLPATQSQAGQGVGGARSRPGYVTADEDEAALFSSPNRRLPVAAAAEEEAQAASAQAAAGQGRRPYVPATQAGGKADKDGKRRDRPDWLIDDAFGVEGQPAGAGVLGE